MANNLTGQVFSRLTVESKADNIGESTAWNCKCECGNMKKVASGHLRSGNVRSCGCLLKEVTIARLRTHGQSSGKTSTHTKEYRTWLSIRNRCYQKSAKYYNRYGGRGIKMCDLWKESFLEFLKDMGECPSESHSIDRFPDQNGDYQKDNCRWATAIEQCNNKTNNRLFNYKGENLTIPQISRKYNVDKVLLKGRIRRNWDITKAVETPVQKRRPKS